MKPLEASHHKTEESRIMRSVCSRGLSFIFHTNAGFVQNGLNFHRSGSMRNKQLDLPEIIPALEVKSV
jgi:hypothetical protein